MEEARAENLLSDLKPGQGSTIALWDMSWGEATCLTPML